MYDYIGAKIRLSERKNIKLVWIFYLSEREYLRSQLQIYNFSTKIARAKKQNPLPTAERHIRRDRKDVLLSLLLRVASSTSIWYIV
jgi:hypothetical protein